MRREQIVVTNELSPREKQVLEMLNEGKSQKEITYYLGLDQSTVSTITYRIRQKANRKGFRRMVVYINSEGEIWRG